MQIKGQLKKAQFFLIKQDLFIYFLWFSLFTSLIFFTALQLESIFYFSTKIKLILFTLIFVLFFILFFILFFQFYRAKKNKITRYKLNIIAEKLGSTSFPDKPDTVLNALQLESGTKENESSELAKAFIKKIIKKINDLKIKNVFTSKKPYRIKKYVLIAWVFITLIFSLTYEQSSNAFYRWSNPSTYYAAPKPFILSNQTGNIHILGGEKLNINISSNIIINDTVNLYLAPIQVSTKKRDSLNLQFSVVPNSKGIYSFSLPELFQDYSYKAVVKAKYFWESWEKVESNSDTIFVTDRPSLEKFQLTIIPPDYSGLPNQVQEGNTAVIKGLKGSIVQMKLSSNRMLESAHLLMDENKVNLNSNYNNASGYFTINEEAKFSINLVDERGITNRDPILYSVEIIPDYDPILTIIQPSSFTELGDDQSIPIQLNIQDDYGFTNLQVAYEVRKPSYLKSDPYVAMFSLPDLSKDSLAQQIKSLWDLGDLFLMPDDEIHFHFELTDNDIISGPKKTISATFIARVPSLEILYQKAEVAENEFLDNISTEIEEVEELKKQFEMLEMKALKSEELDWAEQKSIENSLEKAKDELKNLEKMSEAIEAITEQAEKHNLFSPELLDKFEELSDLINNIIPRDMLKNMSELEEALDEMDMKSMEEALNKLAENMNEIEDELERYLEIFKQLQVEQKFDELKNRMEQLLKQQELLSQDMAENKNKEIQAMAERLIAEEERNLEEFENIKSLLEETSELVKPFNEKVASDLSALSESDITEDIKNSLNETRKSLSNQNMKSAKISSQKSVNEMQEMLQEIDNIQETFQNESISEITKKFESIIQDLLYLSTQEEKLKNDLSGVSRNSPRIKELAARQQLLQDQLQSITKKMFSLSKETFAITPDIGRAVGKASANMNSAKEELVGRDMPKAKKSQKNAMEGLNEAALALFNSMQEMQKSGSANGYEQFLKMMQQMAGQQQSLNEQGMQLSLGQMAASAQKKMMQQMLSKQMSVRKSLDQLMKEMQNSGGNKLGDLSGISDEMDKVIKDLKLNRFERQTQKRQQKILSRMLDSQTSMTQRGKKDERKSSSSKQNNLFEGPGGLPSDMGQREDLALKALNKAVNAGYSKNHQNMIKRYFNSLTSIRTELEDAK